VGSTGLDVAGHLEDRQVHGTTMPPMTEPRNTIMIGSMRLVIAATATSTSSS